MLSLGGTLADPGCRAAAMGWPGAVGPQQAGLQELPKPVKQDPMLPSLSKGETEKGFSLKKKASWLAEETASCSGFFALPSVAGTEKMGLHGTWFPACLLFLPSRGVSGEAMENEPGALLLHVALPCCFSLPMGNCSNTQSGFRPYVSPPCPWNGSVANVVRATS